MMKIYGIEIKTEMKNKSWKNPFPNDPSYVKREKDQKWNLEFYDDEEFAIESIETKVNEEGSLIVEMTGAEKSLKKLMEEFEDNSTIQVLMGKEGFCGGEGDFHILQVRPDPFHTIRGFNVSL